MMQRHFQQPKRKSSGGFSLVELMITMIISVVLIGGILSVFSDSVRANVESLNITRMTQDTRAALDVVTRELRRSGYWSGIGSAVPGDTNPHNTTITDTCILYAYSADDGLNFRGFRVDSGTLEWNRSATAITCASAGWEPISDPLLATVSITNPVFVDASTCTNLTTSTNCNPCETASFTAWAVNDVIVAARQVDIEISATLVSDTAKSIDITDSVRLRNSEIGSANASGAGHVCGQPYPVDVIS